MGLLDWFREDKTADILKKIKHHPDDPRGHFELGVECERLGRNTEAIEAFQQTLKLHPESAETHFNLGCLYEKLKDGRNAIVHMMKAGNLFSERNDTDNKDKARKRVREYHSKFKLDPKDIPTGQDPM